MVRARLFVAALAAVVVGFGAGGQESSHERLGVESKDIADIEIGGEFAMAPAINGAYQGLEIDPVATLDILYQRSLALSIALPLATWLDTDGFAPRIGSVAFGDPSVAIGYSFRSGDWRLGAAASFQQPLGIWNYYEIEERHISSGSGYPSLGLDLSATRFLDPLVAGLRLSARSDLARQGQFVTSSRPLRITLGLSAVEVLNEAVAISVALSNEVDSPLLIDGKAQSAVWQYSLSGSARLVFSSDALSFRIGLSKKLTESGSLPTLEAGASYTIKIKR
jgi:hypothetical protein